MAVEFLLESGFDLLLEGPSGALLLEGIGVGPDDDISPGGHGFSGRRGPFLDVQRLQADDDEILLLVT